MRPRILDLPTSKQLWIMIVIMLLIKFGKNACKRIEYCKNIVWKRLCDIS